MHYQLIDVPIHLEEGQQPSPKPSTRVCLQLVFIPVIVFALSSLVYFMLAQSPRIDVSAKSLFPVIFLYSIMYSAIFYARFRRVSNTNTNVDYAQCIVLHCFVAGILSFLALSITAISLAILSSTSTGPSSEIITWIFLCSHMLCLCFSFCLSSFFANDFTSIVKL